MRYSFVLLITLMAMIVTPAATAAESPQQIGADPGPQPIVENSSSGQLTWDINIPADQVTLSVVGPSGEVYSQRFQAGEKPFYYFIDMTGAPLADGQYTYQIVAPRALSSAESAALDNATATAAAAWEVAARARRSLPATEEGGASISVSEVQRLEAIAIEAEHNVEQLEDQIQRQNGPFVFMSGGSFKVKQGAVTIDEKPTSMPGSSDVAGAGSYQVNAASDGPAVGTMDFTDTGDIMAGSGLAAGNTFLNPSPGELELHSTQPIVSYLDTSSGEETWFTYHATGGFTIQEGADHIFVLSDGAPAASLFVDPAGRVGLGTTSPAKDLEIFDLVPEIRLFDSDHSTFAHIEYSAGFLQLEGNSEQDIVILDGTAPQSSLYVNRAGNIGLGTSTPTAPLHIAHGFPKITLEDTDGGGTWDILASSSSFALLEALNGTFPFIIRPGAPTSSINIQSTGNVGFGTAAAATTLHALSATPYIRLEDSDDATYGGFEYNAGSLHLSGNSGQSVVGVSGTAPSKSLYIDSAGDIGIGTDTPNGRFHVVGTDSPRVRMEDTLDNANDKPGLAMKSPASSGGGEWRFETDNAGNFQIDYSLSAGPEIVLIDDPVNNSRVKINGALEVVGTCTGCDAVFQDGFGLESIEEHASFMWANSYLPAVGPTPDGKTSLNVFEKTVGILQELEKAHIYIAQLHEEKSQLKMAQNEMLDEQNRMADELETLRKLEGELETLRKLESENDELREQLLQISLRLNSLEASASTNHTRKIQ